jgi:hypothetical protein
LQLLCHKYLILAIMKHLSRDEMKKVMGGGNAPLGCGEYEGQTTFTCGTNGGPGQSVCTIDICFCNGTPVPGGCGVPCE